MQQRKRMVGWWRAGALLVLLAGVPLLVGASRAGAAQVGPRTLSADTVPQEVRTGAARLVGAHPAGDRLLVLFMLPLRDWAGLDAFLADVAHPGSPHYGHYLTEAEVTARFGPEAVHAQHVEAWLRANGITDVQTPADRLYVMAHADAPTLDRLLHVQINDYSMPGRTFFAPDRAPTLPAEVSADVQWISGLDSAAQIRSYLQKHPLPVTAGRKQGPNSVAPFYPDDYQWAYDVKPLLNAGFDGTGVNVSITLWTLPPSDPTIINWATTTGANPPARGNNRLEVILTDGSPSTYTDDGEAALDIESSGGLAPGTTVRYYEATQPQNADLAHALDVAGSDPNNRIISNSWGAPENTGARNAIDAVLATHSASGHDYLFSSGDDGSWANGVDPYPDYPTSSAYVTSIGGTAFAGDINQNWPGETTWVYNPTGNNGHPEGSGGGASLYAGRPSWENAPGVPALNHRGYPDVAADADPNTGAYICTDFNGCIQIGGTSLASPLWAGMAAVVDQYLVANGKPHLGFFSPALYTLSRVAQPFPAYHDITVGTNGAYPAGPNWDYVTGIGSPDLWNLARDLNGGGPPPPTATPQPTNTPAPTPTFAAGQVFSDVPPANPFFTQINWTYQHGLVSGYGNPDGTLRFQPNSNATRGQVCKIITLAAGWAIDTSGGPHFSDIAGNPFYNYIETAYHHGVISGYGDGTFHPYNSITRSQFSKVLVLAKGWAINTSGGPHFNDVPPSNPFYGVVETAYNHGIISGYGCGGSGEPCPGTYFRPTNNITRGQLSKLLYFSYGP